MIKKTISIFILSLAFNATVNFHIDMSNSNFPNSDYSAVVINGSWNNWGGWGLTLNDDNQDGVWEGSLDLNNGSYEYVVAVSGPADNWSGWGSVLNAPSQSVCDYYPSDQWANYGFELNTDILDQYYCAGTCQQSCSDQNNSLLRPSNYSNLTTIYVPFEWKQQAGSQGYNLQISSDNSFNSTVLDTLINDLVFLDKHSLNWNNNYWWRVRYFKEDNSFSDWLGVNTFGIASKKFSERNAEVFNDDLVDEGYYIFSGFGGTDMTQNATGIIDKNGNEIWNDGYFNFIMNHVNEHGNIYGSSGTSWPRNTGIKIDYDRNIIWKKPDDINYDNTVDYQDVVDMHEFKQIHNGNYMGLVPDYSQLGPIHEGNWSFLYEAQGYQADGVTNEFPYIGIQIVEWDEDGNEVWRWNPYDYFTTQDTDLYGGFWHQAFNDGIYDWMHTNAFHFDEQESVIYVSHRHLSRISKISYPSGNIIWNMGLSPEFGAGDNNICTDLGFSFQHNIQLLEDGTLIFFDNGNISQVVLGDQNPTTRIRRIRVIDDSFCETVWEYEFPANLFGGGMGSVQLLEDGNYLIYTFGNGFGQIEPTIRIVSPNHETIWNYQGSDHSFWYRAYKLPSLYPDLFSVIADNYNIYDTGNEINFNENLRFFINNKSSYTNTYHYSLDLISDNLENQFINQNGSITIGPNESSVLNFIPIHNEIESSEIQLTVFPENHEYALKNFNFTVSGNIVTGDLNSDGLLNILDVISLVNIIISGQNSSVVSDLNNDNQTNILDVVLLVSEILNN
tara:strand:- start:6324 stop:8672 length:2349 start_codon:yes stop_codon:yes gene_type:complete